MILAGDKFENLQKIIETLRGDNGCAWDKEQTIFTLYPNLIEEVYELIDAINKGDLANIEEEIGDVYLVITMLSYVLEQEKNITTSSSLEGVINKLISRHPHVFGDRVANSAEESLKIWSEQKQKEGRSEAGYLDRVGRGLPPLEKAMKIEKKLIKCGYSFNNDLHLAMAKVKEELAELEAEFSENDKEKITDEMGDLFLTLVMLSEHLGINASDAINRANNKVIRRFAVIEREMKKKNLPLSGDNFDEMEKGWQLAKKEGL